MNLGRRTARGRLVTRLDADDWYEPERLAILSPPALRRGVAGELLHGVEVTVGGNDHTAFAHDRLQEHHRGLVVDCGPHGLDVAVRHVDDLARFISPTKLVIAVEDDPRDDNYRVLRSARKQVDKLRDQDGKPFEVIEIPMPSPVTHDGERLPATYVNFYFVNGALLVPTYRDKRNDKKAIEILQAHLPKHKVIGIDCTELIWGLGAIHCLTQQQPAPVKR